MLLLIINSHSQQSSWYLHNRMCTRTNCCQLHNINTLMKPCNINRRAEASPATEATESTLMTEPSHPGLQQRCWLSYVIYPMLSILCDLSYGIYPMESVLVSVYTASGSKTLISVLIIIISLILQQCCQPSTVNITGNNVNMQE